MAVKPTVPMAKAIRTAFVMEVLPEMKGSRKDAVKQNLDFWRTKPKELPKSHSIPRVTDFPVSKMPTMTITIKRASP